MRFRGGFRREHPVHIRFAFHIRDRQRICRNRDGHGGGDTRSLRSYENSNREGFRDRQKRGSLRLRDKNNRRGLHRKSADGLSAAVGAIPSASGIAGHFFAKTVDIRSRVQYNFCANIFLRSY